MTTSSKMRAELAKLPVTRRLAIKHNIKVLKELAHGNPDFLCAIAIVAAEIQEMVERSEMEKTVTE